MIPLSVVAAPPGLPPITVFGAAADKCTIGASVGSILNDGAQSATISGISKNVDGSVRAGDTVVLSVDHPTGVTITQPSATAADGSWSGSLVSTAPATLAVSATVQGRLITATTSVVVTSTSVSVSGAVALDAGGVPADGTIIQALDGVTLVEITRGTVSSGLYLITGIPSGSNVTLALQPHHAYCWGATEPGTIALGVINANQLGKNFKVQPCLLYDNFAGYVDGTTGVGGLKNTTTGFAQAAPFDGGNTKYNIGSGGAIDLDLTGGPSGGKAMKYSWPNRGNGLRGNPTLKVNGALAAGATSLNITGAVVGSVLYAGNFLAFGGETGNPNHAVTNGPYVADGSGNVTGVTFSTAIAASGVADQANITPDYNYTVGVDTTCKNGSRPVLAAGSDIWVRFVSKETASFHPGDASINTSFAYKFCRIFIQKNADPNLDGGFNSTGNSQTTGWNSIPWIMFLEDSNNGAHIGSNNFNLGTVAQTFDGAYHTWIGKIEGIGSSNCILRVYRDGVLLASYGPFLIDSPDHVNKFYGVSWGSVMNTGPDQAQARWFAEVSISFTPPSMLTGVQT